MMYRCGGRGRCKYASIVASKLVYEQPVDDLGGYFERYEDDVLVEFNCDVYFRAVVKLDG